MTGWQKLWQDPEVARKWAEFPPDAEVVAMADRLEAEGRKRILDVGCGVGRHTVYLAARGFEVTATDDAPAAIEDCKKNLTQAGLTANVVEADMSDLPFADSCFDGAIASHVIRHAGTRRPRKVMDAANRHLPRAVLCSSSRSEGNVVAHVQKARSGALPTQSGL